MVIKVNRLVFRGGNHQTRAKENFWGCWEYSVSIWVLVIYSTLMETFAKVTLVQKVHFIWTLHLNSKNILNS